MVIFLICKCFLAISPLDLVCSLLTQKLVYDSKIEYEPACLTWPKHQLSHFNKILKSDKKLTHITITKIKG